MPNKVSRFLESLIEKHMFFRRLTLVVVLASILWTTHQMFIDISQITGPSTTAYGILTGLLTVAIGFYFKERHK